jgi:type VI secretion system secreted protein VgrG
VAKPYQDSRSVQLDGPSALNGLKVARLHGREAISRPFEYQLSLYGSATSGSDGALDTSTILGQSVTVALVTTGSGPARYFNGIVTDFAHVGYGERTHEYRAVLRPSLWLLTRRADCRIFQQKSTPDIFADVCQQAGSIPYRSALSATYQPWEYRVQYRESDFDFVSRLLEHEGIFYYFEHSAGKHELVLTDDVGKLTSATGYDEVPYYPPTASQTQRDRDHLKTWTIEASFQPAAFASLDYNFETPSALATGASQVASRKDTATYEIFEYPAAASQLTSAGVEGLAKLRAERLSSTQSVSHSEGDAAGLVAGRLFKLTGHPRDDLNQKYLVVATVCELTSDRSQSGAAANADTAPQFSLRLDAVASAAPYRPDRGTPRPLVQGTQTAVVVGPSGKEIWTDKYGRVKVQFHWDRLGKADDNSSCWMRVAHSWAGKNWGAQHVPRVGQEVVVSFLEGDPDRPLIIGSVYNADQMPPYDLPTNGTQSGVKSRSSLNGTTDNFNELRFEDKQGSEEIYLHAEKDLQVVVENNQTITIGATKKDKGDRTTTVQHDDTLSVGNDLSVSVTGAETRTLSKGRATKVQESDKLDVGMQFTVSADEQIKLVCGAASIVLKADGTIEITGATLALSGTQQASVDSAQTAITGTQVSVSGTKTAVQGSGTLDLSSSGVATLKGSLTKIG